MKLCNYCAKEIGYNEQYCCEECEKNALIYYNKEKRSEKIVSVINVICFIGLFVAMLIAFVAKISIGSLIGAAFMLILGITCFIYPFAPEGVVKKRKIKSSVKLFKIIALVFMGIAVALLILGIFTL